MTTEPPISPVGRGPTVFVDAEPFSWKWFAGVPRYTARVVMSLSKFAQVRFFDLDKEILPPADLSFDQGQDLAEWARRIWCADRQRLQPPEGPSVGLYCGFRTEKRRFSYEIGVLHDLCPMVVGWTFPDAARWGFEKFFAEDMSKSDAVISVSHSSKADAGWLCSMPSDRISVVHSGPSLCVENHKHPSPVVRSPKIGLVVSTVEPRKNAHFLIDWFHSTTALPRDMELWWVGKMGWILSPEELEAMSAPPGGRRVRFLGNVPDAKLCELYQQASWSIYPSVYEGFGFPVLDSLRHGTPVLTSYNSSLMEFQHPGVHFFDPYDKATVDEAWFELTSSRVPMITTVELDTLYSWDCVAAKVVELAVHGQAQSSSRAVRAA